MHEPSRRIAKTEAMRLLTIDVATLFVISGAGRIERVNDPDRSPGPRFFFAGCPGGNLARVRHDLSDRTAASILAVVEAEPPWFDSDDQPPCLNDVMDLLSTETLDRRVRVSILYSLPRNLSRDADARIVRGDSVEGERLLSRLAQEGMPRSLVDAGFVSVGDFWEPWCVALDGEEIASMAFAARIGASGAEIGVYTFPGFRGKGLATAVTAS